jgi:alpha-aminoadipate carrier protein LysW
MNKIVVMRRVNTVKCPDCGAELEVPEDVTVGEILSCPDCGLELEVKQNNGSNLELQKLELTGEDWGE